MVNAIALLGFNALGRSVTPTFSILKVSSCQTLPGLSISENFTEGNLKSKPNRRQKMTMFE